MNTSKLLALGSFVGLLIMGALFQSQGMLIGGGGLAGVTSTGTAVAFPVGSDALPGITFVGDPNTGFFWVAADTIGISTAGAERWRIRASGNLVPLSASYTVGDTTARTSALYLSTTDNSGTPGNTTINTGKGRAAFAGGGASSITVTNSLSAAASTCLATLATGDATCTAVRCTPAAGSLTLAANAACTANTSVNFVLFP